MGFAPNGWRFRSADRTRVVLICPQCGQETTEYVTKLRGLTVYGCSADGCEYRFELVPPRATLPFHPGE